MMTSLGTLAAQKPGLLQLFGELELDNVPLIHIPDCGLSCTGSQ